MQKFVCLSVLLIGCTHLFASPEDHSPKPLDMSQMKVNPLDQFQDWYRIAAGKTTDKEASCFILATVDHQCAPSTRTMIARSIDKNGIVFVGNLSTMKFQQLKANPACAATFLWYSDQRQVNFMGKAQQLTPEEAKAIWDKESKSAQIAFLVTQQAKEAQSADQLAKQQNQLISQYQSQPIPMPQDWGGYRLVAEAVEYWQAGKILDSRVLYTKESNQWTRMALPQKSRL